MIALKNRKRLLKGKKVKQPLSWRITSSFMFCFYTVFCAFYVYILFWMVMSACKTHLEIALDPFALPKKWRWNHFSQMVKLFQYKKTGFFEMVWNSTWFSVGAAAIMILTSASTSYIALRYTFPGSKYIAPFILFTLIFPIYGGSAKVYQLMFQLGLHDGPSYLLFYVGFGGWNWFYFQSFWGNLSKTYAEAAKLDGANDWVIFYQILLPQSIGILGALFIGAWKMYWQDYGSAMLYLRETPTLSVGIYYFEQEMQYRARRDILFCACVISSLPIFLINAIFQNSLFKNISLGGIKE